ncbi:LOW QUALITY PROTEIN: hypothetical protein PHMEG_00018504 [Phytophthora megakarya]|uniref:Eukaryotic/viral aspartic protease n=1 Tax=Phytophthora megakarya TaxID=4795 RepID=A0A225VU70_9STRA|nr:LOW QUALITY PROTEIN: hypothetical protein PHMEG_00018504 [Phytophthora megakarya]
MHRENGSDKPRSQAGSLKRERKNQDQDHVSGCIFFDICIGDLSGQNAILGVDFMVPVGVRIDLADGSMHLPDKVGIPLNCRKRLYGEKISDSRTISTNHGWSVGRNSGEDKIVGHREIVGDQRRTMGADSDGRPGRIRYLVISNIGEEILRLDHCLDVGMILDQDKAPRSPGFVSVGSRRYREWQN